MKKKISITIEDTVLKDIENYIDNVFIRNRSQAIEQLVRSSLEETKTAIILSGGQEDKIRISENEFRITAIVDKKPLCVHAIEKLREDGFRKIIIIARGGVLTSVFSILKNGHDFGVEITYVEERECHGTADSLRLARARVKGSFLVVYGDVVFSNINLAELWKEHVKERKTATLLVTTSLHPSTKGALRMEGNTILEFKEKPKQSEQYIVFSPIFAAEEEIFDVEGKSLEKDVFPLLAEKRLLKGHLSSEKESHIHSKADALAYKKHK